jgi:mannitol-1-phosphate/altronate dehydrogenase
MKMKKLLHYYLRSKTNMILSLLFTAAAVTSGLILHGLLQIAIPLSLVLVYFFTSGLILFSRRGAQEIVNVKDEDRERLTEQIITRYENTRERISVLRIGDAEVRKTIEYFLLISGSYLEKCRELASYSPAANHAIEEALTVCQLYLEELDESSTEKRYAVHDKEDFTTYKQKTIKNIKALSQTIKEKMTRDLEGLSRQEQFEVMEELKE